MATTDLSTTVHGTSTDPNLVALKELISSWRSEDLEKLRLQLMLINQKIDALDADINQKIDARDKALELQAHENAIHFANLNNEAGRILKAIEITVSRDTWEGFQRRYDETRTKNEALINAALPRTEFDAYTKSSATALAAALGTATGRKESFGLIWSIVLGAVILLGGAATIMGFFR